MGVYRSSSHKLFPPVLRLVLTLACLTLTLAALLQLRQRHAAVRSENLRLAAEVRREQQDLWQQQLLVAAAVSPDAVERRVAAAPPPPGPTPTAHAAGAAWDALFE